jgi:cytochrome c oxidase subunit II
MKPTIIKNKIVAATLLAAACGIALAAVAPKTNLASAAVNPKVIEITAKKFQFTPSEITLKRGEPVILRLTSTDRVHGFMSRLFKIDTDIPPDKTTDVSVTPASAGNFTIICERSLLRYRPRQHEDESHRRSVGVTINH